MLNRIMKDENGVLTFEWILLITLLVIGIMMQVCFQVILNIAVVTDTIPNTGIGLPFFSYGGTALVLLLAEMGGIAAIRDALIIEAAETAGAIVALSQDYEVSGPWLITISDKLTVESGMTETTGAPSVYTDEPGKVKVEEAPAEG